MCKSAPQENVNRRSFGARRNQSKNPNPTQPFMILFYHATRASGIDQKFNCVMLLCASICFVATHKTILFTPCFCLRLFCLLLGRAQYQFVFGLSGLVSYCAINEF